MELECRAGVTCTQHWTPKVLTVLAFAPAIRAAFNRRG